MNANQHAHHHHEPRGDVSHPLLVPTILLTISTQNVVGTSYKQHQRFLKVQIHSSLSFTSVPHYRTQKRIEINISVCLFYENSPILLVFKLG